ncbi:MAG: selenocysteine-specific translation elongation factor [Myxococcales bacterium]|nr:selenocysteine-specific translation elongation factor [Myxococcales bacterium]
MSAPSLVVGTAGHIDHGKTSLVRTLTGVDLDRLPEEQARGITIALGFTPLDLADGRRVGMVDVPGHERLVRTMISGATGIDAALLCVSAVDGAMPQTREHLAILNLLGIEQGAVVVTMADLVDEELLELALEDVADAVSGTFLEGTPILPFSAIDGRGKEEVLGVLASFTQPSRRSTGPFRMPVDRTFSRPGFGTVATGTVWSGKLDDGDTLQVLPEGHKARVRGIEVHGEKVDTAHAGRRTALNLAGIETDDVSRGTVLATRGVPCTSMMDVRYHHLPDAVPLADGASVRILLGTAERLARLHVAEPLEEDDELEGGISVWAQLRLEAPLPCMPGDRFVLRRTSPLQTLGGGEVVDPWAPKLRKRDRERAAEQLQRLQGGDVAVWLERAGEAGLSTDDWRERSDEHVGKALGDRLFAPNVVVRLQGALLEALAQYHHEQPLSLGAHRRELRRGRLAHLPDKVFDALVDELSATSALVVEGPLVRIDGFSVELTDAQRALSDKLLGEIRAAGLGGRALKDLGGAEEAPALLRLLEVGGQIGEVSGVGWVSSEALAELRSQVKTWFGGHDALSPADFKELTGLTRKAAIPLLEWLDAQRLTRRQGDTRVAGPAVG